MPLRTANRQASASRMSKLTGLLGTAVRKETIPLSLGTATADKNKKIAARSGQRWSTPSPPVCAISTRPRRQRSKRFVWVWRGGRAVIFIDSDRRNAHRTGQPAQPQQPSLSQRSLIPACHRNWLNGQMKLNQRRLNRWPQWRTARPAGQAAQKRHSHLPTIDEGQAHGGSRVYAAHQLQTSRTVHVDTPKRSGITTDDHWPAPWWVTWPQQPVRLH